MKQKISQTITHYLGVIIIGLVVGLSLQFVRAWNEPNVAPPSGDLLAPINTGAIGQSKDGPVGVNGLFNIGATLLDGNVGIGTQSPTAGLKLDVEGKVGAKEYCDENGQNCKPITGMGDGGSGWVDITSDTAEFDTSCDYKFKLDEPTNSHYGSYLYATYIQKSSVTSDFSASNYMTVNSNNKSESAASDAFGHMKIKTFKNCGGGGGSSSSSSSSTGSAVKAYASVGTDMGGGDTGIMWQKINFNEETYDIGENFNANKFIAPSAGVYMINTRMTFVNKNSTAMGSRESQQRVGVFKNESNNGTVNNDGKKVLEGIGSCSTTNDSECFISFNDTVYLAAGDYIDVRLDPGFDVRVVTGGSGAHLSIAKLQ